MPQTKHSAIRSVALVAGLLFCACGFAQSERAPYQQSERAVRARAVSSPAARRRASRAKPSPAVPAATPSLLSGPAVPAKVSLASGKLSVEANNSSLSEILLQVAKAGGMKIEGLQTGGSADPRIFGSYGPGAPSDVLSELLHGSHYNILMMGKTAAGTPRELALSLRTGAGVPNPPPQRSSSVQEVDNEDDTQPPAEEEDTGPVPPAGVHENEPITPPPGAENRVRTPQEILQELQKMNQQQQPQ